MKSFYLSFALLGAASVFAQEGNDQATEQLLKSLPQCGTKCGLGSISATCRDFDIACTCKDKKYVEDLACCLSKSCDAKDIAFAAKFSEKLCGGVGVTDLPKQITCAPGANPSGADVRGPPGSSSSSSSSGSKSSDSSSSSSSADDSSSSSSSDKGTSGAMILAQNPLLVGLGALGVAGVVLV